MKRDHHKYIAYIIIALYYDDGRIETYRLGSSGLYLFNFYEVNDQ